MRLTNRRITNPRAVRVKDIGNVWTTGGVWTAKIKRCSGMDVEYVIATMTRSAVFSQGHAVADCVDVELDVRTRYRCAVSSLIVPKARLSGRRTLADNSKLFY